MKAVLKNYRQSPRKVRLVTDLIKGKEASIAIAELSYVNKKASSPLLKLVQSALANAKARDIDTTNLIIKDIRVDGGKTQKGMRPRSRGTGSPIKKRTSHVTVVLEQKSEKSSKKQRTE